MKSLMNLMEQWRWYTFLIEFVQECDPTKLDIINAFLHVGVNIIILLKTNNNIFFLIGWETLELHIVNYRSFISTNLTSYFQIKNVFLHIIQQVYEYAEKYQNYWLGHQNQWEHPTLYLIWLFVCNHCLIWFVLLLWNF